LLDSGGQLKVAGFGLLRLSKISADKFQLADPGAGNRNASKYSSKGKLFEVCFIAEESVQVIINLFLLNSIFKLLYIYAKIINLLNSIRSLVSFLS
jgi:hypothetical protein